MDKVPSRYEHPVVSFEIVGVNEEGYVNELADRGTTESMEFEAEMVTSEIVPSVPETAGDPWRTRAPQRKHTLMIDLDVPASLVPSTTPGHSHLYIDVPMDWQHVLDILGALVAGGVVEPGYLNASKERGYTALRLPWVQKAESKAVVF